MKYFLIITSINIYKMNYGTNNLNKRSKLLWLWKSNAVLSW